MLTQTVSNRFEGACCRPTVIWQRQPSSTDHGCYYVGREPEGPLCGPRGAFEAWLPHVTGVPVSQYKIHCAVSPTLPT